MTYPQNKVISVVLLNQASVPYMRLTRSPVISYYLGNDRSGAVESLAETDERRLVFVGGLVSFDPAEDYLTE
jgi:hypothetical protein